MLQSQGGGFTNFQNEVWMSHDALAYQVYLVRDCSVDSRK